jgi:hypothetical protein
MKMLSGIKLAGLMVVFVASMIFSASVTIAEKNTESLQNQTLKTESGDDAGAFCVNEGFDYECRNFYGDANYFSISKWVFKDGKGYVLEDKNDLYSYYDIVVTGDLMGADWKSNPGVFSVLVKAGDNQREFEGGMANSLNSTKNISYITFCGYRANQGRCTGDDCSKNGVSEFPALSVVAASLVVCLGIVFIRTN